MWYRRRRRYGKLDLYFILIGIICAFFRNMNPDLVKFLLIVLPIVVVVGFVLWMVFVDRVYQNSIKLVQKKFVKGHNMVANSHCTISYAPNEQIIVMDNHPNQYNQKRMFSIKRGKINKLWHKVCKMFDDFVSLDSMAAFFSYDTHIDIITIDSPTPQVKKRERRVNITGTNAGPKYVEMTEIPRDTYVDGTETPNKPGEDFVEIKNIQEVKKSVERPQEDVKLVDMSSVMAKMAQNPENKIDINNSTESEIALLPGINIIIAKKLIEYRNKNLEFQSVDEFVEIAGLKPHFAKKIKAMVYLGKTSNNTNVDDDNDGRIVDF